ncbi:hypothetical protein [Fontivita pretiosa]|uniref:hypothetical protein n=1 Tax=Fontivita pretiosa TaxID=2989684 RepID=UPI003D17A0E3
MAGRLRDADCPHCGGRLGIGGVALVMVQGRFAGSEHHTYNADQRCPRCGAAPPLVVDIVAPACDTDQQRLEALLNPAPGG